MARKRDPQSIDLPLPEPNLVIGKTLPAYRVEWIDRRKLVDVLNALATEGWELVQSVHVSNRTVEGEMASGCECVFRRRGP